MIQPTGAAWFYRLREAGITRVLETSPAMVMGAASRAGLLETLDTPGGFDSCFPVGPGGVVVLPPP